MHMRWSLGLLVALVVTLAPAAVAGAAPTALYTTMTGPFTTTGINSAGAHPDQWVAQRFVPTTSGNANFVSFWSQCVVGSCPATAIVELRSNANGRPGSVLASGSTGVAGTLGGSPSCVPLPAAPALTAGTTYWAVMRSPGAPVSWNFQSDTAKEVLESTNQGGSWSAHPYSKTLALKVEEGPGSACGAAVREFPAAGTKIGWITATGGVVHDTIFVRNDGNSDLSLTTARITGPGASSFSLLDAPPSVLAKPFRFPHSVAV
jgi:hypothetical protein